MPFLNHWWLIGLLVIVLIVFGPGKLPQIGGAVGQAMREFRKATTELKDEVAKATAHEADPVGPPSTPVASSTPTPTIATTTTTTAPAGPEATSEHKPESTRV